MTLDELAEHYFHDWLSGKYNEGEFIGKASHLSTMFIDEARSLGLAPHEDIMAEAETLEEAVNEKISDWSCQ